MSDSLELRRIRQQVRTSYDIETRAFFWACNPERDKLRRELPFIAAALDYCAQQVGVERLTEMKREDDIVQAQLRAERQASNARATRSNRLRSKTLRRTLALKKIDRLIDGED